MMIYLLEKGLCIEEALIPPERPEGGPGDMVDYCFGTSRGGGKEWTSAKVDEVLKFADKVGVLHKGKMIAYDEPAVIFNDRKLFEEVNISMPTVYTLAHYLRDKGDIVMDNCSTIEEGAAAVEKILDEVKSNA